MLRKMMICLLVISLFLTACDYNSASQTVPEVTSVPTVSAIPTVPETTIPATSEPTVPETTEPDLSLGVEAGSYLLTFQDEKTWDYLDYYLFIPENAQINMPLVVFLHGDGEVGNVQALENYGMIYKAREIYGEEFPFIAISPCTRVRSWIEGTIPETLKDLIDTTVSDYSADPEHIIITGHSRGSMGTWYMLQTYGDYFSAAVPVSAGSGFALNYEVCAQVPVLAFAGTVGEYENNYLNAMRQIVQKLTEIGGQAELILLEGRRHEHTSKDAYTIETFQWMLEQ